jgi:uncharacterized protein (DUF1501 family)
MVTDLSRRAFMQRASALSIAGAATPFVLNLAAIGDAAAATATDYKAIVCVFLFGGNDYANTLIPADTANYTLYNAQRSALAYSQTALAGTTLSPTVPLSGGRTYAIAPELAPILPIFNAGKLAVMLNVGTLIQPTTKAQYTARSVQLPPKLLSHNDQQSFWQSGLAEGATSGWGGRIGDLFQSGNTNPSLTCMNPAGNAVFLSGRSAIQFSTTTNGPIALTARTSLQGSTAAATMLRSMISSPVSHVLDGEYAKVGKRALDLYDLVTNARTVAPTTSTVFPAAADPSSSLGAQLKEVARLISVSSELGAKRQVFFVSTGRFDTHDQLNTVHPVLLTNVADAMRAFYDTTVELGVANRVTTFTASDFGRTLTANSDGSDHGWGSMHFVMGGAVKGKAYYGTPPVVANNGPDDIGQGRLIPTTSVDQYAATMASWFGVSDSDMPTVLPNIVNFTTKNLGFLT